MGNARNRINADESPPGPVESEEQNGSLTKSDESKPIAGGGGGGDNVRGERRDRRNPQRLWAERLEALEEFKAEHGHANVPKNEKYKQLGRFVNNQRQFYRKREGGESNSLTDERVKGLEELGFVWSMKPISENRARSLQAQWEQRLRELREYKNKHGHCNVAAKGIDKELGKFVMNQRYYYKTRLEQKNSLTPERIQDLEHIGFVWTLKGKKDGDKFLTNEEKWERNIEELKKFKEKFGHVNVAKSGEYVELGQFVGNQRYFNRRRLKGEATSLTDKRIATLSDLGFEWKARSKGGDASKVYAFAKTKGGTQVLERDKEIALPDGSTIDQASKESSQKRLVALEDGSFVLETTTKIYTTKIEKTVVPPEGVEEDVDRNTESMPPALPGGLNVFEREKKVLYMDGSSLVCTTKERREKRLVVREDDTELLETTTTTTTTKVERSRIPEESEGTIQMRLSDEPLTEV